MAQETQENGTPANQEPASSSSHVRPGWKDYPVEDLPQPTYWPAAMAFGITFIFWGIVTTFIISGVGLIIFIVALVGWIGDIRHGD